MPRFTHKLNGRVVDVLQFRSDSLPWPPMLQPWPDERGVQPRDMSWGYVQLGKERQHVRCGDWLVTEADGATHVYSEDTFLQYFEPVRAAPAAT